MNPCRSLTTGLLLVLTAVVMVAGQKLDVKVDVDKAADFKAVTTYSWLKSPPLKTNIAPDAVTNPNLTQEVLGPHIIAAIDKQLVNRGMRQVEAGPDVRVVYYAGLDVGIDASELGSYYQYTTGWMTTTSTGALPSTSFHTYEQGSIIVDVIDHASNKAIWRGSISTRIKQETTQEKRIDRIDEAMERMFARFPKPKIGNR